MATISTTAEITSIRLAEQGSTPSTPASGYSSIYAKSNGLYIVDDAGTATGPFKAVTLANDTLWAAKGNIAVATANDTATVLAVGTNGQVLTADSGEATGVKWATPATATTIANDTVWSAKGDIAIATANDTATVLAVGTNGQVLTADSGEATGVKWAAASGGTVTRVITVGKAGALTAVAGSMRLYVPWACTVTAVRASVGVAPTGASLIVDVNKNGTTIFSTQANRPTITATNFTDLTNTPDVTAIAADDYITVDVDQIGATVAGSDLVVQLIVTVP